jgi:hypothetical protein
MNDRLVCADGGNPDPTTTGGKNLAKAKALELVGWSYPRHLAGRAFGIVVHGDAMRRLRHWVNLRLSSRFRRERGSSPQANVIFNSSS